MNFRKKIRIESNSEEKLNLVEELKKNDGESSDDGEDLADRIKKNSKNRGRVIPKGTSKKSNALVVSTLGNYFRNLLSETTFRISFGKLNSV